MNFALRHRVALLFSSAAVILLLALLWPEPKKPGEIQKYYKIPQQQLLKLEFRGKMTLTENAKTEIDYAIFREENPLSAKDAAYRIEIRSLKNADAKAAKRAVELNRVKKFYASALIRTIVQDWSEPDFYFMLPHEAARDGEYGLTNCANELKLTFRSSARRFCIGNATQGDTRRYLLDADNDKLLLTPDFTIRRILNNIFAQREQSIHPYGNEGVDLMEIKIEADLLKNLPMLREKTGGILKLRMLVKDEGKTKVNVWHVDGLLSVMPSHAAELAQLLSALRISAPFAIDAAGREGQLKDILPNLGLAAKSQPGLSGSVRQKKTSEQDIVLSAFAFYPPEIRPAQPLPFQFDAQIVRPKDTLLVTNFNTGYISAELYPRVLAILHKFESDLAEAQKKGEQQKAAKQKK